MGGIAETYRYLASSQISRLNIVSTNKKLPIYFLLEGIFRIKMGESKEAVAAKIASELSDTQKMMYAFGDSRRPKAETAKVLEAVVLSQIAGVVAQVIIFSLSFHTCDQFSRLPRWQHQEDQRPLVWRTCSSS